MSRIRITHFLRKVIRIFLRYKENYTFYLHCGTVPGGGTKAGTVYPWPSSVPQDDSTCYPTYVQIFAFGAHCPTDDAGVIGEEDCDSDDYVGQCMVEVASYLSLSAGSKVTVAMTVNRLKKGQMVGSDKQLRTTEYKIVCFMNSPKQSHTLAFNRRITTLSIIIKPT